MPTWIRWKNGWLRPDRCKPVDRACARGWFALVARIVWRGVVSARGARGGADRSRFGGRTILLQAEAAGWLKLAGAPPRLPALPDLDEGETACIRIALAQTGPALLLMDERAGRAVALEHGLRVASTAAIIGMAKARGLIPSAHAVFARLHASHFRISAEVISAVLRRVGET